MEGTRIQILQPRLVRLVCWMCLGFDRTRAVYLRGRHLGLLRHDLIKQIELFK